MHTRLQIVPDLQPNGEDCPSSRHLAQIGAWISGVRASSGV